MTKLILQKRVWMIGTSQVVSIPKLWANSNHIGAHDSIEVEIQSDCLIFRPVQSEKHGSETD